MKDEPVKKITVTERSSLTNLLTEAASNPILLEKNGEVFLLTQPIMERSAQIRGSLPRHVRQQIGDLDILIAATCLAHNLTLLTRNLKDFQQIPDLKLYQST
jgi:predicted nucleic acid-binding protein